MHTKILLLLLFSSTLAFNCHAQDDKVQFNANTIIQIRDVIERGFNFLYRNDYHAAYNTFTEAENSASAIVTECKSLVKAGSSNVSGDALLPNTSSNDTAIIFCRKYLKSALDAYLVLDYQIIAVSMSHVMVKLVEVKQHTRARYQERRQLEEFVTKFSNDLQAVMQDKQTNSTINKEALRNLQQFILTNFQIFAKVVSNDIDDVRKYTNIITNAVLRSEFTTNWFTLSNQMDLYLNYLDMQSENVSKLMGIYSNYFYTMIELQQRMQRMEEENARINLLTLNNARRYDFLSVPAQNDGAMRTKSVSNASPAGASPWSPLLLIVLGIGVLFAGAAFIFFRKKGRAQRDDGPSINMDYLKEYIESEDKMLKQTKRKKR
ncbi:MAG: hypothetical protein AABZ39_06745 [Spirochaetota bacterium]